MAFSTLALLAAIHIYEAFLFLIPVIVFFSFHFTKLYRLRSRILGGLIIFIIVAMISAGLSTSVIYSTEPVVTDHYTNLTVATQVYPYAGNYSSYNFTMTVMDGVHLDPSYVTLAINTTAFQKNVTSLDYFVNSSGDQVFYYVYNNPPPDIYSYNFTFENQTGVTLYTGFGTGSGPDTLSIGSTFKELFIVTVINDVIIFEIILVAGVFIGRSFSRSARNRVRPPQRPGQPEVTNQNNNQ